MWILLMKFSCLSVPRHVGSRQCLPQDTELGLRPLCFPSGRPPNLPNHISPQPSQDQELQWEFKALDAGSDPALAATMCRHEPCGQRPLTTDTARDPPPHIRDPVAFPPGAGYYGEEA
ncbi:hypothetical protein P7K49_009134 [Saguinus oedipus]|uniref:Uncharacterized protein n=1 Tax=Saguinus oedipus TaxID=9490 RepID=A0ABQ9VZS2_SAGOE|nr:hypothetical protein P7K49_009134 [Saguinus oedipus]